MNDLLRRVKSLNHKALSIYFSESSHRLVFISIDCPDARNSLFFPILCPLLLNYGLMVESNRGIGNVRLVWVRDTKICKDSVE